ncbi:MAG: hypothetical protein U0X91_02770 [Spirosomataceae bacterium]
MNKIQEIASKYQVSEGTVRALLEGLKAAGGRQVQFNISELGGMGQWQSGMVMIGDMFNHGLKAKVSELCSELATLSQHTEEEMPEKKGTKPAVASKPAATFKGSQNGSHYTYYAKDNLLEVEEGGRTVKYDTSGYALSGVQQSQSNDTKSLSFSYPGGTVRLKDLKKKK